MTFKNYLQEQHKDLLFIYHDFINENTSQKEYIKKHIDDLNDEDVAKVFEIVNGYIFDWYYKILEKRLPYEAINELKYLFYQVKAPYEEKYETLKELALNGIIDEGVFLDKRPGSIFNHLTVKNNFSINLIKELNNSQTKLGKNQYTGSLGKGELTLLICVKGVRKGKQGEPDLIFKGKGYEVKTGSQKNKGNITYEAKTEAKLTFDKKILEKIYKETGIIAKEDSKTFTPKKTNFENINKLPPEEISRVASLFKKALPKEAQVNFMKNGYFDWDTFIVNIGEVIYKKYKKDLNFDYLMLIKNTKKDIIIYNITEYYELLELTNKIDLFFTAKTGAFDLKFNFKV